MAAPSPAQGSRSEVRTLGSGHLKIEAKLERSLSGVGK
jgi:hypothetical protein